MNPADVNSELIIVPGLLGASFWGIANWFPENNQAQYKTTKVEANGAGLELNSS